MEALSPDTQATLLLTCKLGGAAVKPLSHTEFNKLARLLVNMNLRPGDLLGTSLYGLGFDTARLGKLLGRGTALALTLEKWSQAGINVVSRGEGNYPAELKAKLRAGAAPVLFYCGALDQSKSDGLCIVGSRDATASGLLFASRLGRACANENIAVISGAARGVDREAMEAALSEGGRSIGVVAEALMVAALAKKNRTYIQQRQLLLLSPFDPEARFTVSQAMERNRYLYALAKAAVVVDSDVKGGTWSGAIENAKYRWTPAFVRVGKETKAGNEQLAQSGLLPFPDDSGIPPVRILFEAEAGEPNTTSLNQLQLLPDNSDNVRIDEANEGLTDNRTILYDFFCARLLVALGGGALTEVDIAKNFGLEAAQVEAWLGRCLASGLVDRAESGAIIIAETPQGKEA